MPPKTKEPEEDERQKFVVCWGEEKFSPVAYNTFGVGPFFLTLVQKTGEDDEAFRARIDKATDWLNDYAQKAYVAKRRSFWGRYNDSPA